MTDTAELKHKFWKSLADSPFLFLQLDTDPRSAVPMTAQLDKDADSAIWFFTGKDRELAQGGPATATFSGSSNQIFARFSGTLTPELSRERLDKHWSQVIEAWFPGGKDDPNLLMLRMDLGDAELWSGDQGVLTTAKMAMGMDVRQDVIGSHTEAAL